MQIVIDIPEGIYKVLCKNSSTDIVRQAVIDGTPLPKGHGRLVDEKDLSLTTVHYIVGEFICTAPTIIEADKENV